MKTSKRILSVLLSALLVLLTMSALGGVAAANDMAAYGPCGDNINWKYSDGVLTISGQGALSSQVVQFPVDSLTLNEQTGVFTTETKTLNVRLFPWYPALEDQLAKKYGYSDYPQLKNALAVGMLNSKTYYRDLYSVINTIVIEEGVTSIPEAAFSTTIGIPYLAKTLSLPSTLISLDPNAMNTEFAEKIIIANPNLVIGHSISLMGFIGSAAGVASSSKLVNPDIYAANHDVEVAKHLSDIILVLNDTKTKCDQKKAEADAAEDPAEKAAILAEAQAEENALVTMATKYFFTKSATAGGTIKELIARLNTKLGTALEKASDVGTYTSAVFAGDGSLETPAQATFSPTVQAKIGALNDTYIAAFDAANVDAQIATYYLGEAPMTTVTESDGSQKSVAVTPASWITIYGKTGSTAQNAASVSKVKFESLESAPATSVENSSNEDTTVIGGLKGFIQRMIDTIKSLVDRIREAFTGGFNFDFGE